MTILDLMNHRAGFIGLPPRDSAAARLRREAVKSLPANQDVTQAHCVTHLAASPLETHPGTVFRYGLATIVLGRVIAVITGKTLDVALHVQIFLPLGVTDTFFTVPGSNRSRVVSPYALKLGQDLVRTPLDSMTPRFLSAGGNLYGTAAD